MSWDHLPEDGTPTTLPCGNTGYFDGTGFRCDMCFTIYGSVSNSCHERYKLIDELRSK